MVPDYEERERPSWSEIDKRKDRSSHRQERPSGHRKDRERRVEGKYKAALESLFDPNKKLGKVAKEKLTELREMPDRSEFMKLADAFVTEFGFPTVWEDLEDFLRHKDPKVLSEVVSRMEELLPKQSETRKGNFQKDLDMIEMTTRDKDLRKQVHQVLSSMSKAH